MSAVKSPKPPAPAAENANPDLRDPVVLTRILAEVAEQAQPLLTQFFEQPDLNFEQLTQDPLNLRAAYAEFMSQLWSDPQRVLELQMKFWQEWAALWQQSAERFLGQEGAAAAPADKSDRRFKAAGWDDSAVFSFIKQSYLLTSRWLQDVVRETELNDATRVKVDFFTRQFLDAIAPSNFPLTNPDVLRETIDSRGENLIKGLHNMLHDLQRGHGALKISTTDYEAFKIGENIAVTPGKVIYQNELMQLIQYAPSTETVFATPLLIIPPWINKYYILDLKPENSFVKWLVDQGHTVFMISWVNPGAELAHKKFDEYMQEGLLDALTQIEAATGEKSTNVIGYCLGGTLLSVTMAWLAVKNQAARVASATLLTSMADFAQAGDMLMFTDAAQLTAMDEEMAAKGFLPAAQMQQTFALLRANDMIWSFVINNYLLGKEPFPFDLLYWNDDSTNMPAAVHSFYLRKCYLENVVKDPGGITLSGISIDLRHIKTPAYFLSTKEDHISPWRATYASTQIFGGPVTFTLAASGHVAGVINPPAANKYGIWTGEQTPADPEDWLAAAKPQAGSWWPHWQAWVQNYAGARLLARQPGSNGQRILEDAPGSYVKVTA